MIWVFLLVVSLTMVLIKLGAMSVWVTVLSGALQAIFFVPGFFVAVIVWRYWRRR